MKYFVFTFCNKHNLLHKITHTTEFVPHNYISIEFHYIYPSIKIRLSTTEIFLVEKCLSSSQNPMQPLN